MIRTFLAAISCLMLGAACSSTVKPKVEIDPSKVSGMKSFDYTDWTEVLKTYVDDAGRVNYSALKANREGLDRFVALIAAAGPRKTPNLFKTKEDRLAYYINAYNALTMFNVINRLPKFVSVNDDPKNFFYFTEFVLDGQDIALYDLENKVIRPTFKEPRIHFALNCASVGCPQLPNEPFLPEKLEEQLTRETVKFLHEERNVKKVADRVLLSQIFEWYAEDFPPTVIRWINGSAADLEIPPDIRITYRPYDWTLNKPVKE
ncbi:MAG: DUF547 domain-containing protein [Bradymonadia bacterium]